MNRNRGLRRRTHKRRPDVTDRAGWLRGSAWLISGSLISLPLTSLSFVVLARLLGPSDLGRYSLVVAATSLASTITTFRLETHLLVALGEAHPGDRTRVEFEIAIRSALILTLPVLAIGLLAIALFPVLDLHWWVIALASLEVLIAPAFFSRSVLQARAKQSAIASATVLGRVSWIAWVLILLVLDKPSIPAIIGGRIFSLCLEIAYLRYAASLSLLPRKPANLRGEISALRRSAPLALAGITGVSSNRIDQFLVTGFAGARANGLYASGVRLAELVRIVPAVVQNVLTPALVSLSDGNDAHQLRRAFRDGTLLMVVPTAFLASVLVGSAEGIVELTLGNAYSGSTGTLALLAIAEVPVALSTASAQVALAVGDRRVLASSMVLGLAINIVGNLILIPRIGISGAAISSLIAYSAASLRFFFARSMRTLGVYSILLLTARSLICLFLAASVGRLSQELWVSIPLTAVTFGLSSLVMFPGDTLRLGRFLLKRGRSGESGGEPSSDGGSDNVTKLD